MTPEEKQLDRVDPPDRVDPRDRGDPLDRVEKKLKDEFNSRGEERLPEGWYKPVMEKIGAEAPSTASTPTPNPETPAVSPESGTPIPPEAAKTETEDFSCSATPIFWFTVCAIILALISLAIRFAGGGGETPAEIPSETARILQTIFGR